MLTLHIKQWRLQRFLLSTAVVFIHPPQTNTFPNSLPSSRFVHRRFPVSGRVLAWRHASHTTISSSFGSREIWNSGGVAAALGQHISSRAGPANIEAMERCIVACNQKDEHLTITLKVAGEHTSVTRAQAEQVEVILADLKKRMYMRRNRGQKRKAKQVKGKGKKRKALQAATESAGGPPAATDITDSAHEAAVISLSCQFLATGGSPRRIQLC